MKRTVSLRRFVARRLPGLTARLASFTAPLDWRRGELRVLLASGRIAHSRLHPQGKEPWTVAWLERCVRSDDVVWDVGANVGGYSLIAARLGAAAVVAVEPDVVNAGTLVRNAALNGLGGVITLLPVALTAHETVVAVEPGERDPGSTHRMLVGSETRGASILGFPLDVLVSRFAFPPPSLLKIDVDGLEADVLEGATATLAREGLRSLLVEIDEPNWERIGELTSAAGLSLVERHGARDGRPLGGIVYGVFERR